MTFSNKKSIVFSIVILLSTGSFADKPSWAGNGAKPSKYEKREHKDDMTSKNEYKKKHKDDYDDEKEYIIDRDDKSSYDDSRYREGYEGKGQTDEEFIDKKVDETKKNWIGKVFDFLN